MRPLSRCARGGRKPRLGSAVSSCLVAATLLAVFDGAVTRCRHARRNRARRARRFVLDDPSARVRPSRRRFGVHNPGAGTRLRVVRDRQLRHRPGSGVSERLELRSIRRLGVRRPVRRRPESAMVPIADEGRPAWPESMCGFGDVGSFGLGASLGVTPVGPCHRPTLSSVVGSASARKVGRGSRSEA